MYTNVPGTWLPLGSVAFASSTPESSGVVVEMVETAGVQLIVTGLELTVMVACFGDGVAKLVEVGVN